MCNVEGRFVIWHLHDRGCSVSEIAGESGHDRKTAPKVLPQELLPTLKAAAGAGLQDRTVCDHPQRGLSAGVWNAHKRYTRLRLGRSARLCPLLVTVVVALSCLEATVFVQAMAAYEWVQTR